MKTLVTLAQNALENLPMRSLKGSSGESSRLISTLEKMHFLNSKQFKLLAEFLSDSRQIKSLIDRVACSHRTHLATSLERTQKLVRILQKETHPKAFMADQALLKRDLQKLTKLLN